MRVAISIPERVYEAIRKRAASEAITIQSLIVRTVQEVYPEPARRKGRRVTGPIVRGKGKLGSRFPKEENPHDLIIG